MFEAKTREYFQQMVPSGPWLPKGTLWSKVGKTYLEVQGWQYVPSGPYIGGGVRHGIDYCQSLSGCASIGGYASFPGGGGGGAQANGGGCCYGSHGAGGLVIITYR